MKRFKVGDRVLALSNPNSDKSQPRVKGVIYEVNAVMYCNSCGVQVVNIGVKSRKHTGVKCVCGCDNDNRGLHWTLSSHFALVDDLESEIAKAVEDEDYELAQLLHDVMNRELVNVNE